MTDHPITPPPELVEQWAHMLEQYTDTEVFTAAARWGADQELEACVEWLYKYQYDKAVVLLLAARRPKPPSLKERALQAWAAVEAGTDDQTAMAVIRRALEALPND
jgi:hypothetical protein